MTTLADITNQVTLALSSAAESNEDISELIYHGIVAGHEAILPWLSKTCVVEITSGSSGYDYELPTDCYVVDGVYDESNNKMIPKLDLIPGIIFKESTDVVKWIDLPYGYIRLNRTVEDDIIGVIYRALWNVPLSTETTSEIELPRFAHTALVIYATAYVGFVLSGSTADLRQYGNQTQSGVPTNNPLLDWSNRMLKRFMEEVSNFPKLTRSVRQS